ncbi:DUF1014-domain-containing protein [Coprinopsis marcescibilis]|uniref:DUF1014-domain-containing protein n=1 Tax=Coprinopsis marcescibilis TaxID=230819 RepID=A0A5C3KYN3_COPMA|nr:DUF1014-domain-containing protein [Coprinopsis marcescibilis]
MPPKGGNAKKESGKAKKADNEAKKAEAAAADKERKVAADWDDGDVKGGKAKKAAQEDKRKADLARKAEAARLLAEEEASAPAKVKATPKASQKKKDTKPAGPGAIAAGGLGSGSPQPSSSQDPHEEVESYTATGIDNALDLLDVVTAKLDKASIGQKAAGIERHPERRFKAAYEAYSERELPNLKVEHPGLRLQQYKDLLYKNFQKSPENPFNQATVTYDATKEEKLEALNRRKGEIEERLREKR